MNLNTSYPIDYTDCVTESRAHDHRGPLNIKQSFLERFQAKPHFGVLKSESDAQLHCVYLEVTLFERICL
jgi:hypothetical protein